MLQRLSEQVQECYQRAHGAKLRADATDDPTLKADFLEMEKHWLTLARSYQFSERLFELAKDPMTRRDCKKSFERAASMPSLSACGSLPLSNPVMTQ
jgi:hypothetical protein